MLVYIERDIPGGPKAGTVVDASGWPPNRALELQRLLYLRPAQTVSDAPSAVAATTVAATPKRRGEVQHG